MLSRTLALKPQKDWTRKDATSLRHIFPLENVFNVTRKLQMGEFDTAVKPAATPKCMVNLAAALFFCARIYGALRRSSAGLSPAFTKPIFFFFFYICLTYTYKQEQENKSKGNIY